MKTRFFSQSIRRWFGNIRRERLAELRQPKKGRQKAKPHLRPTFELLEDRTMLSVLPPPIVLGQTDISGPETFSGPGNGGNESSPAVAVDPLNPQKMVLAYNYTPTKIPNDGNGDAPDQTTFVEATFSTDGGKTWTNFFDPVSNLFTFGNFSDPAEMTSMSDPDQTLELADSPSVAIDRFGGLYLVFVEHNPDFSSGDIVLQKFDFSGATPATLVINQILYGWAGTSPNASDAALNPTVVIDNNPASFTDPVTNITQVDSFSGAVYIAWTTRLAPPNGGNPPPPPTFNPNTIQVIGSFDHGATFSGQVPLDGNGFAANFGFNRDTAQQFVIGQASVGAASTVAASPAPSPTSFAGGSGLSSTDQFYDGFALSFTDGPDTGLSRTVITYTGSSRLFTFASPWPTTPAAGNHFNLSRLNGGQLTGVWDDFGSGSTANPKFDNVVSNSLSGGGGENVHGTTGFPGDALTGTPNTPVTTPFTADVNINDGRVPTVTHLDVSVTLSDQNLSDLHLKLLSPTLTGSNVQAAPSPSTTSFAGDSTLSNNSIAPINSFVQATAHTVQAAPAPTTTTFAGDASLSSTNNFYNGQALTFATGANAGQTRTVQSYNGTTKVFSFATAWATAPAAGDTFNIPGLTTTSFPGDPSLSSLDSFYNAYALTFTSGINAGVTRTVLSYSGSTKNITLATPLPSAPAGGDTFTLQYLFSVTFTSGANQGLTGSVQTYDGSTKVFTFGTPWPSAPAPGDSFIFSTSVVGAPAPSTTSFAGGGPLSSITAFYVGDALTFTSGANQGQTRTILSYSPGSQVFTFSTFNPWAAAPAAGDTFVISQHAITLVNNKTTPDGTSRMGIGINGMSLGIGNGVAVGTVFDDAAERSITDTGAIAPFIGHFQPEGAFDDNGTLSSFAGAATSVVNGQWSLLVTDTRNETMPMTPFVLEDWFLNFTSGMQLGRQSTIATSHVRGALVPPYPQLEGTLTPAVSPDIGIGPGLTIAQDNTLGSFSPFQGRIYVSFVAHDIFTGNPVDNTYIVLYHSDDGGLTWSGPTKVNDDSISDNFSGGDRPKFEPQLAVDQTTGTVVVSFLDSRNDPSRSRYATYLAISIDGGNTFAPETFVNEGQTATDVITGKTITVDPIGDNVSTGNPNRDTTFGMGFHQALAVAGGHILPFWAGNFDGNNLLYGRTSVERSKTDILTAQVEIAAGPRIISSTMGPVQSTTVDGFTFNNTRTADGIPIIQGFAVTFDRPIDATWPVDPVTGLPLFITVFYRDTVTPAGQQGTLVQVASVTPLNASNFGPANAFGATDFFVRFQTPQHGVGTYSYAVGPGIRDDIRTLSVNVTPGVPRTFNSTINNQSIPDVGAIDNPIVVSGFAGNQVVTNVRVTVNIQHTQAADLILTLIAPDGTPVTLAAEEGSPNDPTNQNFTGTTFADGFTPIRQGTAPYTGFFSPEGKLSDMIGKFPNGTWTLEVNDAFVLDSGTLLNWSLRITPGTKGGAQIVPGNFMDQNANSVTDEAPGDIYAIPRPLNGIPFQLPYDPNTLPLIIPGPHIISTFVPNNPVTPDNLVLNQTNNAIDVVFDRDMDPTTFTPAAVLRMMGPTGQITGPFTITPDPNNTDPDHNHPRTFKIGFPTQQLSGTYTITLAPVIRAKAQPGQMVGDLMDTNLNAGVDVLRGVATNPLAASLTPISHSYSGPPVTIAPGKSISIPLTFGPENFVIPTIGQTAAQSTSVQLNITYPNDPDLELSLVAPDGTSVKLFTNFGASLPPPHANFTNTTFNDFGATPIQSGVPPYNSSTNGPFDPQTPLSVLNGKMASGVYQLVIKDDATSVTGAHTLNSWSITLWEAVPGTGLGEAVADQATAHFRIFTMDTQNPLAHNVWTAVGPASNNGGFNSGRIGGLAVDPSDPSGNTVYVAGASGGVWKTTNFLTTDPGGPTYIPLTDFGPTFAINIGSIAVFGRNNDPNQSIIFASTGEGDTGSSGVGVIISTNGGATWNLLDSTVNVDANGNYLPINSTVRDHMFVGTTSFKIVVDPVHAPSGPNDVIVYMALGGSATSGGLWRSLDSGKHWTRMTDTTGNSPSAIATDILLAPASALPGSGNLALVYAAFEGAGVYKSGSQGTNLTLMAGNAGNGTFRDANFFPPTSIPVSNDAVNPNGAHGRIVLATAALTGNPVQDLLYEGWLYAAVVDHPPPAGGNLLGLFLTKDGGGNWTQIHLPVNQPDPMLPFGFPTNDESKPDHDPLGFKVSGTGFGQGNYDISLAVDPTNPNISYLGGTNDFQLQPASGLIRIDATKLFDPHSTVPFDKDETDGGALMRATNGGIVVKTATDGFKFDDYGLVTTLTPYVNLLTDPLDPFLSNSTLLFTHVASFTNEGQEAVWGPFDGVSGTTDQHRVIAMKDPLTGHARLIFGDDQGVYTVVDRGDGTLINSIGSAATVNGPRSGNLQITQFYYGAAQPSILAAQIGQALFYGNAQDDGFPVSDPNILNNGNIGWHGPLGDGSGIATDPTGSGSAYSYQWPCCGAIFPQAATNFFQVAPNGPGYISRTGTASGFSLVQQNQPGPVPDPQWPFLAHGAGRGEVQSNFAVNPINGNAIVIGSDAGRLFRTEDQGKTWFVIGDPTTNNLFDGTNIPALAFGAPDPANPSNQTDDFIYVGTTGGRLLVTPDGGGHWFNISSDGTHSLDGTSVMSISANPTRGSHEAYLVTTKGVYHVTFQFSYPTNAAPTISNVVLTNITGNVFNLITNFSNPNNKLLFQLTTGGTTVVGEQKPLNYLTSIVADWRFQVPPTATGGFFHPFLYIGGEGGVYRSTNEDSKTPTWTIFPNVANDGSPVDGGYLPMAHVTDLNLAVGNVNPTNGKPDQAFGFNLLIATTYGRGTFAIRLPNNSPFNQFSGPQVQSLLPDPSHHADPPGSLSAVKVTFKGAVDPATFKTTSIGSFLSPTGASIQITSIDNLTPAPTPGQPPPPSVFDLNFATQNTAGVYTIVLGPNIADFAGNLMDQDADTGVNGEVNGQADDIYSGRFFLNGTANGPFVPAILGHDPGSGQLRVAISNGNNAFNDAMFGTLSTAATWVDVVTGDFNGDGKTDIAARYLQTGQWWVGINTGNAFSFSLWTTWSTAATWVDVHAADFTGDGKTDIVGRFLQGGQWWMATSLGNSFNNTLWASWSTAVNWVDVKVGDFNGDGKADITGRVQQSGQWWSGISTGNNFTTSLWGQWSPAVTWVDVQVGDFNGDGKDDIAGRYLQTGQWWVSTSDGSSSFTNSLWTAWSTAVTWVDVKVGDFNGDGKMDIVGRALELGQWWMAQSTGTSFANSLWASWSTAVTWQNVVVGDFNGDGKADIAGMENNVWWTGLSTGTSFATTLWDTWPPANWTDVQTMKST